METVAPAVSRLVQETLAQKHGNVYYEVQAAVDRAMLREVLQHVKGNQVAAANLLGISRTTLRSKLRSLGLLVEKQVCEIEDYPLARTAEAHRPNSE
jgi:two-component system nitrogen regulation response regulator GlnG